MGGGHIIYGADHFGLHDTFLVCNCKISDELKWEDWNLICMDINSSFYVFLHIDFQQ